MFYKGFQSQGKQGKPLKIVEFIDILISSFKFVLIQILTFDNT